MAKSKTIRLVKHSRSVHRVVQDKPSRRARAPRRRSFNFETVPKHGRVSVLIPAYRTPGLVKQAVQSSLDQELPSGWDLEVLVGVDACTQTLSAVKDLEDPRLRVVEFKTNTGPYPVLNALFRLSTGEAIAILDSDDFMKPGRLLEQVSQLRQGYDFVGSRYEIEHQGLGPELPEFPTLTQLGFPIHSTWCVKRTVYNALGGYKPWRCGADTDFWIRALACKARARMVQRPLMVRRVRPNQLTSEGSTTGPGSTLRERAQRQVSSDLARFQRGYSAPRESFVSNKAKEIHTGVPRVVAVMPTLPNRQRSARLVLQNLLKQGVDLVVVHLNGHKKMPSWVRHPRVRAFLHPPRTGPIVRWKLLPDCDLVLSVDDDIIYPHDYVRNTVKHLLRLRRGRGLSYHGTHWSPGKTALEDRVILPFSAGCSTYVPKSYFGCGVSAFFRSDLERVDRNATKTFEYLDDVWMSAAAARAGIFMYRPPSPAEWISVYPEQEEGIFKQEVEEGFRSRKRAIAEARRLGTWHFTPQHQPLPVL